MLEPSPRLKKEAKRIGCEPNHIILADLILCGYTNAEAYDIAYSENVSMSAKMKIEERERVFASEGYKRAYEEKRNARKFATENVELRDKNDVVREVNNLINQATDVKQKADLLKILADIQQMKKDATSDDEDPVQFFFGLSCDMCPLLARYNEMLGKKYAGKERGDLEKEVLPDEMQRLIEQADNDIRKMRIKEKAGY
jgi:hypothetical protein